MSGFYPSIREADVAALQYNGIHYECYVWVDREAGAIDAAIFVEQKQGEKTLLLRNTVFTDGAGQQPASPKIIVTGSIFLVFYLDGDLQTLHKSWIDVSNLHSTSTWTQVAGSLTLKQETSGHPLYDVHTCGDLGGSGDTPSANYVLGFKESVNGWLVLHQYTSHSTWAPNWSKVPGADVPVNCLAVYANATQGDMCCVYQKSGATTLSFIRGNESDGLGRITLASMFTHPATSHDDADWTAVGICYAGADLVAVVGECLPNDPAPPTWLDSYQRMVCYRTVKPSDASQVGNEFSTKNVSLQSRPWHGPDEYTDGVGGADTGSVHVVLGHMGVWNKKSADNPYMWADQSLFVANLHLSRWATEANGSNLAVPVANLSLGTADAREHQWWDGLAMRPLNGKRRNHVSSAAVPPQYGPHLKTRTTAQIVWRKLSTEHGSDAGLNVPVPVPAEPSVRGYVFHHEAPWFPPHQVHPHADQTANYDGLYTRGHIQAKPVGNGLFICGGTPSIYDGASVVENGYCWPPEIVTTQVADADTVDTGKHYWTAVYTWRDARGQLHRSMPARPSYEDVAAGKYVQCRIRCQNLTLKHGAHYPDNQPISIEIYRTKVDGSTYYRTSVINTIPVNNVTGWDIQFNDKRDDNVLIYEEILPWQYVHGQWAPMVNFQPPALTTCTNWQNRIWGVSAEDEREIWYSMEMFPEPGGVTYEAPRWNPANRYRFDECSGVTALQQMDGALVVFARDRIFILRGLGNTDVGSGSNLEHQIVADGVGCVNPKSVVLGPPGVFFQSDRGYHLLTRTLELEYLSAGAAVEDKLRSTGNIRAAILLEDRHEIRLFGDSSVFDDQIALSYNYLFGLWHHHTLPQGYTTAKYSGTQDAVYWRGQDGEEAHAVLQTSTLHVERPTDANTYKDTGSGGDLAIGIILETDWIHLSGLDGFNRLRKVLVQCEKPQASEMTVILYVDYSGSYKATGDDSASFTFTSPAETVLVAVSKVQKCNAFRVRILESGTIPKTENVSIQGIRLEYAKKPGPMRLPDAYRVKPT